MGLMAEKPFRLTIPARDFFRSYMRRHPKVLAFENEAWGRPVLEHMAEYLNFELTQPNHAEIRARIIERGRKGLRRITPADIRQWAVDTKEEMKHPEQYLPSEKGKFRGDVSDVLGIGEVEDEADEFGEP